MNIGKQNNCTKKFRAQTAISKQNFKDKSNEHCGYQKIAHCMLPRHLGKAPNETADLIHNLTHGSLTHDSLTHWTHDTGMLPSGEHNTASSTPHHGRRTQNLLISGIELPKAQFFINLSTTEGCCCRQMVRMLRRKFDSISPADYTMSFSSS